jgi:hypothetical protein
MYEIMNIFAHRWTVTHTDRNGFCIQGPNFPNKQAAERHAAYLNAKAIQKATERAAKLRHANKNPSTT